MDHKFCPGSKILRQPAPEFFTCGSCGEEVEIWTDELMRNCLKCGTAVYRDAGMSCLEWCKHGKECVGDAVFDTFMKNKSVGVKRCLQERIRSHFGEDRARIAHAEKVLETAEKLLESESADWHIVIPASILHDVGIPAALEKHGSAAGEHQEIEGPPIAREILLRLGLKMDDINEICDIIANHHSPGKIDSDNFRVLYDADCLVNLADAAAGKPQAELAALIEETFLTVTGLRLAREQHLVSPVGVSSGD